jgi:hypothetical protein
MELLLHHHNHHFMRATGKGLQRTPHQLCPLFSSSLILGLIMQFWQHLSWQQRTPHPFLPYPLQFIAHSGHKTYAGERRSEVTLEHKAINQPLNIQTKLHFHCIPGYLETCKCFRSLHYKYEGQGAELLWSHRSFELRTLSRHVGRFCTISCLSQKENAGWENSQESKPCPLHTASALQDKAQRSVP